MRRPRLRPEKEAERAVRWGGGGGGGQCSRKPGQQVTLPGIVFPCDISPCFCGNLPRGTQAFTLQESAPRQPFP